MAASRKYDAGSKSFVNASIATTSVCGSRFRGNAAVFSLVDVDVELLPQAASRPPADPIATAPEATPAAPRRNCRRLYRPSLLAIILPPSHVPPAQAVNYGTKQFIYRNRGIPPYTRTPLALALGPCSRYTCGYLGLLAGMTSASSA